MNLLHSPRGKTETRRSVWPDQSEIQLVLFLLFHAKVRARRCYRPRNLHRKKSEKFGRSVVKLSFGWQKGMFSFKRSQFSSEADFKISDELKRTLLKATVSESIWIIFSI